VTAPFYVDAPASRVRLDMAFEASPPFLRPVIEAVRSYGCGLLSVGQSSAPFRLPEDPKRPGIIIIGDDLDRAVGPQGFHLASVRRAIKACKAFAVVSCEPLPVAYACLASSAVLLRQNVMIIETRPEQEIAWANIVRKLAPDAQLLLALVKGGRA
jgi:hypothetical protein